MFQVWFFFFILPVRFLCSMSSSISLCHLKWTKKYCIYNKFLISLRRGQAIIPSTPLLRMKNHDTGKKIFKRAVALSGSISLAHYLGILYLTSKNRREYLCFLLSRSFKRDRTRRVHRAIIPERFPACSSVCNTTTCNDARKLIMHVCWAAGVGFLIVRRAFRSPTP